MGCFLKYTLLHLYLFHGILNICSNNQVLAGLQDGPVFMVQGRRYKAVFSLLTNPRSANKICSRRYRGSLASVTSQYLLETIGYHLKRELNEASQTGNATFWVCGKVPFGENYVVPLDAQYMPSFQKGESCVVLSTWFNRTDGVDYDLRAWNCRSAEHGFLCVLDDGGATCAEGVTTHERDVWFEEGGTRYIAILHTRADANYSETLCNRIGGRSDVGGAFQGGGATLAMIDTSLKLETVWQTLNTAMTYQHTDTDDTFWVSGRTSVQTNHTITNLNSQQLTSGDNCVLLAKYASESREALYSKQCNETGHKVLCQIPIKAHGVHTIGSTQYIVVLGQNALNQSEAEKFCQDQYDGKLASTSDTYVATDVLRHSLPGQLTSDVHMFWFKREYPRSDDRCDVWSVDQSHLSGNQYSVDYTTVPCAAKLGFICTAVVEKLADYYYIGSCGDDVVSSLRYRLNQVSETNCAALGGAVHQDYCHLQLCGSNNRERITDWRLTWPGGCRGEGLNHTFHNVLKSECTRLKGQYSAPISIPGFGTCALLWCNTTYDNHLTYVISHDACPVDHVTARVNLPLHALACDIITNSSTGNQIQLVSGQLTNVWQDCNLVLCQVEKDCKTNQIGGQYQGTLSSSMTGKPCLRWDEVDTVFTGYDFPDENVSKAENFCRNPSKWVEGPYCYVERPYVSEPCKLSFCYGHGPQTETLQLMDKQYIFVPGFHQKPWEYCAQAYGAEGAMLGTNDVTSHMLPWLRHLQTTDEMRGTNGMVLIGGRLPTIHKRGIIQDTSLIDYISDTGWCVYMTVHSSDMDRQHSIAFYADDCAATQRQNFMCERQQVRFENYQVEGGTPQFGIHGLEQCVIACTECHRRVLDEPSIELRASSVRDDNFTIHGVDQANLKTRHLVTMEGAIAGAWMPRDSDQNPYIQVIMPQLYMIYGVVTKGRSTLSGSADWVVTYNISYSYDCSSFQLYKKTLLGNRSPNEEVTAIVDQAFYAQCVKLLPVMFHGSIALRFDLLACKVQEENVALGKKTYQGSIYKQYTPSKAVDGFLHADEMWDSCSVTEMSHSTYFAVDLRDIYDVDRVAVQNRRHCCVGRLEGFSVKIGFSFKHNPYSAHDRDYEVCAEVTDALAPGELLQVPCQPPITGRFVLIRGPPTALHLAICEIQVFSSSAPLEDVALRKPAVQSSNYNDGWGTADRAVDGNMDNGDESQDRVQVCVYTRHEHQPWWMVDLQDIYAVEAVAVTGRKDCCEQYMDVIIYVGETKHGGEQFSECNQWAASEFTRGETKMARCQSKLTGNVVKIVKQTTGYLLLCEVQVYGKRAATATYGGNGKRQNCVFPFLYNGTEFHSCISQDKDKPWCAVTKNFDNDALWGYCFDVRLRDGRFPAEGRVEVLVEDRWQNVCDDKWNDVTADVICRQLGYSGGVASYPPMFPPGKEIILLNDISCYGNESALIDCQHTVTMRGICSAPEAAGVRCFALDGAKYYGQPAFQRQLQDTISNSTVLINDPIQVPGFIESWNFYSNFINVPLFLQVWRRMYGFQHLRYMLVGESRIVPNRTGHITIIAPHHSVRVEPGDVLGLTFHHQNPVPYDNSFHCNRHAKMLYRKRATALVGSIHTFYEKNDDSFTCRLYSLYAKIQVEHVAHVHEFRYANEQYRVYLQHFSMPSADAICKQHMGDNARLLHLTTLSQTHFVQEQLLRMALNGTFWISNTMDTEDPILSKLTWAPCQPEPGRRCLAMANGNTKGAFLWYTKYCSDKHFILCQFEVTRNESQDENRTHPATDVTTTSPFPTENKSSHRIIRPFVAIIVLIVVVTGAVLLIILAKRYIQRTRGVHQYRGTPVHYRASSAEDEDFLNESTSVTEVDFVGDSLSGSADNNPKSAENEADSL